MQRYNNASPSLAKNILSFVISSKSILLFFDGSCSPINPNGNMGAGFVAYECENLKLTNPGKRTIKSEYDFVKIIHKDSWRFKFGGEDFKSTSNNLAEHIALNRALLFAKEKEYTEIVCFGDSAMVVNQMVEKWDMYPNNIYFTYGMKNFVLKREIQKEGKNIHFFWIPRKLNSLADSLSK